MNQKLKCILSAVLAIVMLTSAAIAVPATAAQNEEKPVAQETAQPAQEAETQDGSVIAEGLEEIALTDSEAQTEAPSQPEDDVLDEALPEVDATEEAAPAKNTAIAETGATPEIDVDVKPYRSGAYENRIVLKWSKLPAAEGFRVYWVDLTKKNAEKKLLANITANTLSIHSLKRGAKYRFYVRQYITKNGKVRESKATKSIVAGTVPAPVTQFRLTANGSKATTLKWKKVNNIDGYLMLRQYQGKWSAYKYLGYKATSFTDKNVVPGHTYYYKLMTYRKDSKGYLKSPTALVKTICGLTATRNDGSGSRANKITFSWEKNRFATGYLLSRSSDNKNFKSIGKTTATSYTTEKLKTGTMVYLHVTPYRIIGKSKTMVTGTTGKFAVKASASKYAVGDTYIEIDISEQHMWYVVNNSVYVSTPVVTGNYNSSDTPTGTFYINNMARNISLVGADYVSFVEYWMCFIGTSYGIHDASWRSSFGGDIFRGNGSHGCVNTPYDAVKKIYNRATVGTPVIIHW